MPESGLVSIGPEEGAKSRFSVGDKAFAIAERKQREQTPCRIYHTVASV